MKGKRGRRPAGARSSRLAALALLVGAVAGALWIRRLLETPYRGYASPSVLVEIPAGSSTSSILRSLEAGGVLRDHLLGSIALLSTEKDS